MTASEVVARAEKLGWPAASHLGGVVAGEGGWRREAAFPINLTNLARELDRLEAAHEWAEAAAQRAAAEDVRRDEARTLDPKLGEQVRAEAEAIYREHERRRPERVERLLGRAVEVLELLAKRAAAGQ